MSFTEKHKEHIGLIAWALAVPGEKDKLHAMRSIYDRERCSMASLHSAMLMIKGGDVSNAIHYLKMATESRIPDAIILSMLVSSGRYDTPEKSFRNESTNFSYSILACSNMEEKCLVPVSCHPAMNVAYCKMNGVGTEQDIDEAIFYYRISMEQNFLKEMIIFHVEYSLKDGNIDEEIANKVLEGLNICPS